MRDLQGNFCRFSAYAIYLNTAILRYFLIFVIRQFTHCEDNFWGQDWGQNFGSSKKQSINNKEE